MKGEERKEEKDKESLTSYFLLLLLFPFLPLLLFPPLLLSPNNYD